MATAMNRNATAAEDEPELVDTNPTMANLINALIVSPDGFSVSTAT